ncbi:MAG: 4Fe-4S binding protein, partial [Calditrichia bacterium]
MESLVIWFITFALIILIIIPYYIKFRKQQKQNEQRKREAVALGIDKPRAQFPFIDQANCIGCGSCVLACPEGDVLGVVFGKATVINGMRCVGHGLCEPACPVGAIEVGLGDIKSREDIPQVDESYESNVPGIFIVGELGGISLIRNAIEHGTKAVTKIAGKPERSQ